MRNVDKETWKYLKTESTKAGLPLGRFLNVVVSAHKHGKERDPWKEILYGKRRLSKKLLNKVEKVHKEFRRNLKFRDGSCLGH